MIEEFTVTVLFKKNLPADLARSPKPFVEVLISEPSAKTHYLHPCLLGPAQALKSNSCDPALKTPLALGFAPCNMLGKIHSSKKRHQGDQIMALQTFRSGPPPGQVIIVLLKLTNIVVPEVPVLRKSELCFSDDAIIFCALNGAIRCHRRRRCDLVLV